MEAFAMYFAFICDADPGSVWRGDRGLCARFFADVRQICCCQVEDKDVLSCWDKVSRDLVALRAKDTGYVRHPTVCRPRGWASLHRPINVDRVMA